MQRPCTIPTAMARGFCAQAPHGRTYWCGSATPEFMRLVCFENVACEQWTRNAHSNKDWFFRGAYGWDMALE